MQSLQTELSGIRFTRHAPNSLPLAGQTVVIPVAGRPLEVVCAELHRQPPLAVMVVDAPARHAWMIAGGTRRVADALMPPMRPASATFALALALGALAFAPLALAAAAYAGYRGARRAFRRRMLRAEVELLARGSLAAGQAPPPQVRSDDAIALAGALAPTPPRR